jgi:hypothetical protein
MALFYDDVPPDLAEEAIKRGRGDRRRLTREPLPLDAWPGLPARFLHAARTVCSRPLPTPRRSRAPRHSSDEIDAGHCAASVDQAWLRTALSDTRSLSDDSVPCRGAGEDPGGHLRALRVEHRGELVFADRSLLAPGWQLGVWSSRCLGSRPVVLTWIGFGSYQDPRRSLSAPGDDLTSRR